MSTIKKVKSICIISMSPVARDIRVLRQIKYLAPYYNLTVIGYGQPHPSWSNMDSIVWNPVDRQYKLSFLNKIINYILHKTSIICLKLLFIGISEQ